MRAWEGYWFGPVAAIRPYLLMRASYAILAFDLWVVQAPRGGRYGAGGFDVAHFRWLDLVRPLPSADLWVGLVLALGLLALVCALSDPGRWARALVALLHTYSWAMSLHDTYQHHYFLSIALTAFVFFPRVGSRSLAVPGGSAPSMVSAWASVLLGANVAIVYAYAGVAKLDPAWRSGEVLRLAPASRLGPLAAWAEGAGIAPDLFWAACALGIAAMEFLVAAGYLLGARQDDGRGRVTPILTWSAFLLALGFHLANELVMTLSIGWFSAYMVAFACAYLLPPAVLGPVGVAAARVAGWLDALWRRAAPRPVDVAVVAGAALVVAGAGFALDLPGGGPAGVAAAVVLVGATLGPRWVGRRPPLAPYAAASALAAVAMWATVAASGTRHAYYLSTGLLLERLGERRAAMEAFENAERHGSASLEGTWRSGGSTIRVTLQGAVATGVFVEVSLEARRLGFEPGQVSFVATVRGRFLEGQRTLRYGGGCYPEGRVVPMIGLLRPGGATLATHFYNLTVDAACRDTGVYRVPETLWQRATAPR
jgi:hypothetical protein